MITKQMADGERIATSNDSRLRSRLVTVGIPVIYQGLDYRDYFTESDWRQLIGLLRQPRLAFVSSYKNYERAYAAISCVAERADKELMITVQAGVRSILRNRKAAGFNTSPMDKTLLDPQVLLLTSFTAGLLSDTAPTDIHWLLSLVRQRLMCGKPTLFATDIAKKRCVQIFNGDMLPLFNKALTAKVITAHGSD